MTGIWTERNRDGVPEGHQEQRQGVAITMQWWESREINVPDHMAGGCHQMRCSE